jgi:hypothetical protein
MLIDCAGGSQMNDSFTYSISRFAVCSERETLVEHAELVRERGALILRVAGEPDRTLPTTDVASAVAADPILSEIRANQITRIEAGGIALDLLPFALSVPGDPDDFDETLWSKTLAKQHTNQNWVVQHGVYRVAYVNDARWCPWPTADGPRMLPENWPIVDLSTTWACVTFTETASMTSGLDEIVLGLVTPRVVVGCGNPDSGSLKVAAWQRNGEASDDARIFVEWLLDWLPDFYSRNDGFKALMTQLFVEAECHGKSGAELYGSRLAAGWDIGLGFGDTDTSEWTLELNLPNAASSLAEDLIAGRGGLFSAIIRAASVPDSPEGQARRVALQRWDERQADSGEPSNEEDDEEYDEEYDEEEDEDDEDLPDEPTNELNGQRILGLLASAAEDGLSLRRIADSLLITGRALTAAVQILEMRNLVVTSSNGFIVWLPPRRLSWLQTRAKPSPEVSEEIDKLVGMQALSD